MTETQNRKNAPTSKMLEFARKISERQGIPLPKEAETYFDACKAFLDAHGTILPPSEKALKWAQDIAKKKQIPLSAEICADARKLSAWIEEHKAN